MSSDDATISRAIDERNRRIRLGLEAPPPAPPPRPVPRSDEEETQETQMERQSRLHREAHAPPAPTVKKEIPPAYRPENQPKKRKRRKWTSSAMAHKAYARQDDHRVCDVKGCGLLTDGMSSMCERHKRNRRRFGSPLLTRQPLLQKDCRHLVIPVRRYLKRHPPPLNVLDAMASFLVPAEVLRFDKGRKPLQRLRQEMTWWRDPRARKRDTHFRNNDYTPRGYLHVLIAVSIVLEERQGRGFPHESEHAALMRAVVMRHKRPGRIDRFGKKRSLAPNVTVIKALAKRWLHPDRSTLRMFVVMTAKDMLVEMTTRRDVKNKTLTTTRRPTISPTPIPKPTPVRFTITAEMLTATPTAPHMASKVPEPTPVHEDTRVKIMLPPRYLKPRHAGRTTADTTAWQTVEQMWRRWPEGWRHA